MNRNPARAELPSEKNGLFMTGTDLFPFGAKTEGRCIPEPAMTVAPDPLLSPNDRTLPVNESSPLLDEPSDGRQTISSQPLGSHRYNVFQHVMQRWIPSTIEQDDRKYVDWRQYSIFPDEDITLPHGEMTIRSTRRRLFLLLTEPSTSIGSATFFVILILAIALSNVIMILQTMKPWQFIPTDCLSCGGSTSYLFEDGDQVNLDAHNGCVCPPAPLNYTVAIEDWCVYFFTLEWVLKILLFEPAQHNRAKTFGGLVRQWVGFVTETTTVLDAFATFPYYLERFNASKGLLSLRLLRLFRVFRLVRLGQYNDTFNVFVNVMAKSMIHLKLLLMLLIFGAAFFGSMIFWLEKGDWTYWEESGEYEFVRMSPNGVTLEISPFFSIPQAFWWFLVTATTLGYGDLTPTSAGGKLVAIAAMLTGVLVVAFPVSVFTDLWHKELLHQGSERSEQIENGDGEDQEIIAPGKEMDPQDIKQLTMQMKNMEVAHEIMRGILQKYDIPYE